MKVAICLVVKNEAIELPYWLAWYHMIGFDTFYIFNDFSDDNTENVILSLKNLYDIRYFRNQVNRDRSCIRQARCYNKAADMSKGEFDWLAMFDADEYLDLYGKDIKTYLTDLQAEHPDKDIATVAFNWCCVGPNEHVARPAGCPIDNYRLGSKQEMEWNRHTKVIFRPERLRNEIYQVHNVIVEGANVDSSGKDNQWISEHGGFSLHSPSWEGGRLIHYQTRGIEHFVNRMRNIEAVRNSDMDPIKAIPKDKRYSEHEINLSPEYYLRFREEMLRVTEAQCHYIQKKIAEIDISSFYNLRSILTNDVNVFNTQESYNHVEKYIAHSDYSRHDVSGNVFGENFSEEDEYIVFTINNNHGGMLRVDDRHYLNGSNGSTVYGLYLKGSKHIHLVSEDLKPIFIPTAAGYQSSRTFEVFHNGDDNTFSMALDKRGRYLGFDQNHNSYANRMRALAWEDFTINKIDNIPYCVMVLLWVLKQSKTTEDLIRLCKQDDKLGSSLINAIIALPEEDKYILNFISGNIINEHLWY